MPHFMPTKYSIEIVGESKYQKAIKEISLYKDLVDKNDLEFHWDKFTAQLVLEDNNKFDPGNAVRVDIEGQTVGYLDKDTAQLYRKALAKLGPIDEACTCKAAVHGKRYDSGKSMKLGIWLFIEPNRGLEIEPPKPPRKKLFGIF